MSPATLSMPARMSLLLASRKPPVLSARSPSVPWVLARRLSSTVSPAWTSSTVTGTPPRE